MLHEKIQEKRLNVISLLLKFSSYWRSPIGPHDFFPASVFHIKICVHFDLVFALFSNKLDHLQALGLFHFLTKFISMIHSYPRKIYIQIGCPNNVHSKAKPLNQTLVAVLAPSKKSVSYHPMIFTIEKRSIGVIWETSPKLAYVNRGFVKYELDVTNLWVPPAGPIRGSPLDPPPILTHIHRGTFLIRTREQPKSQTGPTTKW